MFGSHYHEGDAEKRVGTGGINAELFAGILNIEVDECTGRFAYPVFLLELDIRKEINIFKSFEELVCVCGYAEIPYILRLLNNIGMAYIALAAL